MMRRLEMENRTFFPVVLETIRQGHRATILARGNSMRPFIEDNRDKLVFAKADSIAVGDVVLAELEEGHYVCHRVVKLDGGMVTMRGDGNPVGTEVFPAEQVRAKLVEIVRKGKTYTLATSKTWRLYSVIWPRLLPLRRYLLALYRLIWCHQWPERWKRG